MLKPWDSETFQEHRKTVLFLLYVEECLEGGCDMKKISPHQPERFCAKQEKKEYPWKRQTGHQGLRRLDSLLKGWIEQTGTFSLPVEKLTLIGTDHGDVVPTKHEKVLFNNGRTDAADLVPCMHEEATCRWCCMAWVHPCNATLCRYKCCSHRSCKIPIHFLI